MVYAEVPCKSVFSAGYWTLTGNLPFTGIFDGGDVYGDFSVGPLESEYLLIDGMSVSFDDAADAGGYTIRPFIYIGTTYIAYFEPFTTTATLFGHDYLMNGMLAKKRDRSAGYQLRVAITPATALTDRLLFAMWGRCAPALATDTQDIIERTKPVSVEELKVWPWRR